MEIWLLIVVGGGMFALALMLDIAHWLRRRRRKRIRRNLMRGLVGFWVFREGEGGKVVDLSGNGNHGTLTSGD